MFQLKQLGLRITALTIIIGLLTTASTSLIAQTVSLESPPEKITPGKTTSISAQYDSPNGGIIQVQLFTSEWKKITESSTNVEKSATKIELKLDIPSDIDSNKTYLWQVVLYDANWKKLKEQSYTGIVCQMSNSNDEAPKKEASEKNTSEKPKSSGSAKDDNAWLPPGEWTIDWWDEFEGSGQPKKWFPMLGYNPEAYAANEMKGLRWSGRTEDSAWMYSTKSGNHLLDGKGNLVLRIVSDKTDTNEHGPKAKAAYLLSGYPDKWDKSEPNNVKWAGKFVSPNEGPLYICARVKTNEVKGHSTWFAFWLFSETRAYNDNPADGTEVDIIEIAKGKPGYMKTCFNVANHWKQLSDGKPGSEAKQFNSASNPPALDFVDVTDDQFHTYGILWAKDSMKCFVDGKLYYTFTENIPSDPVDMMMLLTMEFKPNAWDPNQGDGRTEGPFVSDNDKEREMSRAYVDFVRVYRKSEPSK